MRQFRRPILLTLSLLLVNTFNARAHGDGILISWAPNYLEGASQASFDQAKGLSVEAILAKNVAAKSWPDAYHVLLGANEHKTDKAFLAKLIEQLSDTSERKLTDTTRLIIWERITSGDILFEGKGMQVSDDLFSVAGRANWILRTITGHTFGFVRPHMPAGEIKVIQDRWRTWLAGEKIADLPEPYPTEQKGLEEIHSREALEALIVSLKPSDRKNRLTKECLAALYQLDELPSDPANPARLCSPDTYTRRYLSLLTEVAGEHDAAWWSMWWSAQNRNLKWDPKSAKFR